MPRKRPSLEALEEGIKSGNRTLLSRAITLAESSRSDDQQLVQDLLARILPDTGKGIRLGISGVPGAGKSTMIEALGMWLIERGKKLAVLTIDPSSARTGGSILGDKTRMPRLSLEENAYIRPSPSSGVLGGVARRTREALLLCEASGCDVVIVESVGVGQSEAELAQLTDTFCLILVPGAGDELQGIKRGIVELCDLIVVNKADGDRVTLAKRSAGDYRHALRMLPPATPGWTTPVLTASARESTGLAEMWEAIEGHRALLERDGLLESRRAEQQLRWLDGFLREAVHKAFMQRPGVADALETAREDVAGERVTVPAAAEAVLEASGLLDLVRSTSTA